MARSRLAACSLPLPLLLPSAALLALAFASLAAVPASVDARRLQEQADADVAASDDLVPLVEEALRERRSPQEDGDSEPVDPEQKPQGKPSFWKGICDKLKKVAAKVIDVIVKVCDVLQGVFDQDGGSERASSTAAGSGNAETMRPDRMSDNNTS